jgi:hypothetical protein
MPDAIEIVLYAVGVVALVSMSSGRWLRSGRKSQIGRVANS